MLTKPARSLFLLAFIPFFQLHWYRFQKITGMQNTERSLHHLEKIVAIVALAAVFALSLGFAQAAELDKGTKKAEQVFLRSAVVLVQDATSGETLLAKNQGAVLPIASITKLMTAIVILDAGLNLEQRIAISDEDYDHLKGTRSRLRPGTVLTRDELLLLALMSSENRAAASLARTYPGGTGAFVAAMNAKARALGMSDTRFVDPSGLSSANVATARDLARLVAAAHQYPLIRQYSTRESATVRAFGRPLGYRNTNGLVRSVNWDIDLSKTGYISEAGRCLVMRVHLASREVTVVLLDSWGKLSRVGDANRIKKWLEAHAAKGQRG
ncbi:MAG: D-alanyl-D-alanine endopeptidase [Betaproteobacteria bacterium]|nr:D-alanyl-D-alanine endopeptidase [Betaproteobacteria bacterium]MSQ89168.1 D-alanyl-D-alanine endopeptidase [Betaproteobacteria bacterium]